MNLFFQNADTIGTENTIMLALICVIILVLVIFAFFRRYKKCPSDQVMVVYGKTGGHKACTCIHGGAKFIWPIIQDYGFLSLRPVQLEVNLQSALCLQNIRINVPSVFTVGISIDETLMGNAANRLLGLRQEAIAELAKDIILGQLRLVIASMTIEQINSDRETFLHNIEDNVTGELQKIGLQLLNVNITDISDESGYIDAIGKRAAAEAINQARVDVAEEERKGGIGEAEAIKEQRIAVSKAEAEAQSGEAVANRERRIAVKQAEAEALTGEAEADKQRRIAVKQAEAEALTGEAEADKQRRVAVKQAEAEALTGEAEADKQRRVAVKQAEAIAVEGENLSVINIAKSNANRAQQEAEAYRLSEVAKKVAEAAIEKAKYEAEMEAQRARAGMEEEKQRADTIVRAKIEKEQLIIQAEAEAEKKSTEARGTASEILQKLEAEAKGNFAILKAKGDGYREIIKACNNDSNAASKMLLIEKLQEIVKLQTEAIRNIKIDKVTVWDSAGNTANGKSSTANFLSGMMQSLPPIHDLANMAGINLPDYLGKIDDNKQTPSEENEKKEENVIEEQ